MSYESHEIGRDIVERYREKTGQSCRHFEAAKNWLPGGWPWVNEMIAVCWKHPNVYMEIGAVSPKYIGTPGTGWEPLLVYGNSLLQDRVLFATDNMLPPKRCIDELKTLPLKDRVKEKWLGENAVKLLGLR